MKMRTQAALACLLASLAPSVAAQMVQGGPRGASTELGPVTRIEPLTGSYDHLTDSCVEVTNFHPEPMTGMAYDTDGNVWAVNPYGSQVVAYSTVTLVPDLAFDTGLNPVSVGVWEPGPSSLERKIVVVCAGTHAAFLHSADDGAVEAVTMLESEPSDLLIDPDNAQAWVSCAGSNRVLQLDLATFSVVARYDIPVGERPGPLALDRGDDLDPLDNRVYVAQTTTGNNSIPQGGGPGGSFGLVRDLDGSPGCDLPDLDVYRIDPFAGTVEPVVKNAGSLLFDVDVNPVTGDLWILSTKSINKDPALDSEPKLNGRFAINQLKLVPGVASLTQVATAGAGIDLDDHDTVTPDAQYDAALSIGQARTMDFFSPATSAPGWALVASAHNDVILGLDPTGTRVLEFQLPPGAQCHDIEIWPLDENIFGALCLGTMTLEFFAIAPFTGMPFASVPLGFDPTPDQIARGRDVFLDGSRSEDARFSCGSCHPGGRADQLAWPLRGEPADVKDIMVTQSLLSIADTFPHHWRGERDLADFFKAFGGLLGAPLAKQPDPQELDDFVVFMQSLQAPANPLQNPRRVLDDALTFEPAPNGIVGSAVKGQQWFQTISNFNNQTCGDCHTPQTGTSGNLFVENGSQAPLAASIEVAHLRQLQHKSEETVVIDCGAGPREVNQNGFGFTHAGGSPSSFDFIVNGVAFFNLSEIQRTDVFRFVQQFDQGISPACHWAAWFDQGAPARLRQEIEDVLIAGAHQGWNDVVAFGTYDLGGGPVEARWSYDPDLGVFLPDDPALPQVPWAQLAADTEAGLAANVVLGVPPCNGLRFGIDQDNDGVINGQELLNGTDPYLADPVVVADTTPPVLEALELEFATARMAKYSIETDEDATYEVSFGIQGGLKYSFERDYFSRRDTFVLTHFSPSTPTMTPVMHDLSITLTDRAGNSTPAMPVNEPFTPQEAGVMFPIFGLFTHVAEIEWLQEDRVGDTLEAAVRLKMNTNYGAPDFIEATDLMVFGIIALEDPVTGEVTQSTTFTTPLDTTFDIVDNAGTVTEYQGAPGPPWWVSELTEAVDPGRLGETIVDFKQPGLVPGQRVIFAVMGVGNLGVDPEDPANEVYASNTLFQFQQQNLEDARILELVF